MSALGVTLDGAGAEFALFSEHATGVELCLFDHPADRREQRRVALERAGDSIWRVRLPSVRPDQLYGYRVDGAWNPARGLRFNRAKVLLDPYAKALGRLPTWHASLFAHGDDGVTIDPRDSAAWCALGRAVVADDFDWQNDRRPAVPWQDTVIYELHVKGMTALHPQVPAGQRGTYLGLAAPAVLDYLRRLGVTAVELMPVHAHVDEQALVARGLVNYWGYNTLGYFAPDPRFACVAGDAAREFKAMVRAFHAAGIEVILDVVYNHTAEGDHTGPSLSFRGIDNSTYYRLKPDDPSRYQDFTGCGNTINMEAEAVSRLVMDSLRYWVEEMHVDGFRFDLAVALGRGTHGDRLSSLFEAIGADPAMAGVKLIAEPWDAAGGYRVGGFPPGWSEWNGRYRDTARRFWRGDAGVLPDLATRIAGSSDLFGAAGRGPAASLNFVTSHDGFTLADLVSFAAKHNEDNGEDNRDGETNNFSWNGGVEGPSADPAITAQRDTDRRNLLLTLAISQGVPMISGGDERGRTQRGNNNAYCQDSPLSWTPWEEPPGAGDFAAFVARLFELRAAHPTLRRATFLEGRKSNRADVAWLMPDGTEFTDADWSDPSRRALGVLLDGSDPVLILLNAGAGATGFILPDAPHRTQWTEALSTAPAHVTPPAAPAGTTVMLPGRTAAIWI